MVPGGGSSNNMLPDLMQINPQSQMGYVNPQIQSSMPFNNNSNNTHMGNLYRPPGLMNGHQANSILLGSAPQFGQGLNVSAFPFNGQLANFGQGNHAQLFGHGNNNVSNIPLNMGQHFNQASGLQNGQFGGLQNMNMNMNQFGNLPLLNLNPSQVAALAQLMGCANQVAQAIVPQNTAFVGNAPQLNLVQPNNVMRPQLPVTSQQMMQNFSPAQCNPASSNPHHTLSPSLQGNPVKKTHGMQDSYNHRNNNFMKRPQRDASNQRFQKSQDRHMHSTKRNDRISDENGGKGHKICGPDDSANQSKSGKKRSLSVFYTEKEIQQWREERKKNFPSKANVEKKLVEKKLNADAAVEEAKLRRQQLKDVLAKQAELGFEVPEIPSHYLMDTEDLPHGKDGNKKPFNDGRFQNRISKRGRFNRNNRFDKRRGTEGNGSVRRHERFAKRKRVEGDELPKTPPSIRKPTLLQKLLSPDIRRDEHRMLQALRFMVINSFFKDGPEKPLEFPKVIVKETEVGSEVIEPKPFSSEGQPVGDIEDHDTSDDSHGENGGCQEEGEITD